MTPNDAVCFVLGRLREPRPALVLHLNTLDPMKVHAFLRQWHKDHPDELGAVVVVADAHLRPQLNQLPVLFKAVALAKCTLVGVMGDDGAVWGERLKVDVITGKPRGSFLPDATARRTAFLNQLKTDAAVKEQTRDERMLNAQELRRVIDEGVQRVDSILGQRANPPTDKIAPGQAVGVPVLNTDTPPVSTTRPATLTGDRVVVMDSVKPQRIQGRVRSGQLLVHPGDVVIEGSLHSGGEVVAHGDIHVYGTAGGRLLAGVAGDVNACIYVQTFDAELVSIAGRYHIFEDVASHWKGQPLKISLRHGELCFEGLDHMPRHAAA